MAAREGGPVVLVVEDKPYVRELLETVLRSAGCRVEGVADGRVALERAAVLRPDLILLDFVLPGLDGREVLSFLRGNPELSSVPVVVMSAWADAAALKEWEGASGFLYKPFTVEELMATIKDFLWGAPDADTATPGTGEEGGEDRGPAGAAPGRPAPGVGAAFPPGGEG